jgi:hypothetical protein
MKKTNLMLVLSLLAGVYVSNAQADVIVDTGVPTVTSGAPDLTIGQWLAAEINLSQEWVIDSINGYLTAFDGNQLGNTFTVSVYSNSANNLPDGSNVLYSGTASYQADGWNGVSGINLDLTAGNYWVAFEPGNLDSNPFQGSMPVAVSAALATTAWYDPSLNGFYRAATGSGYDIGVQVTSAVPLPSSLLMFVSGLLAVAQLRQRKSA